MFNSCFFAVGWVLAGKSKDFRDFTKGFSFPKNLSLNSYSNP